MKSNIYHFILNTLESENWNEIELVSKLISDAQPKLHNYLINLENKTFSTIMLTKEEILNIIGSIGYLQIDSLSTLNDTDKHSQLSKDNDFYKNCLNQKELITAIRHNYYDTIQHAIFDSVCFDQLKNCAHVRLKFLITRFNYIINILYRECTMEEKQLLHKSPLFKKYEKYCVQFNSFLKEFLIASKIQYDLFIKTNFGLEMIDTNNADVINFTINLSQTIVRTDKFFHNMPIRHSNNQTVWIKAAKNDYLNLINILKEADTESANNAEFTTKKQCYIDTLQFATAPFLPLFKEFKLLFDELLRIELDKASSLLCMKDAEVKREIELMNTDGSSLN